MIFIGILGLFSGDETVSKLTSILIIIIGIIAIFLAFYSLVEPLYAAILVGICLILEGIALFTTNVLETN